MKRKWSNDDDSDDESSHFNRNEDSMMSNNNNADVNKNDLNLILDAAVLFNNLSKVNVNSNTMNTACVHFKQQSDFIINPFF